MKFISGHDRNQIPLFASSLEAAIDQDKEVHLIDCATEKTFKHWCAYIEPFF